jgi:formate/nitrite transporter FocA (FNT family)
VSRLESTKRKVHSSLLFKYGDDFFSFFLGIILPLVCHGRLGTKNWKIFLLGIKKWKILPLGHQEIKNLVSVFHFNLVKCLNLGVNLV